MIKNYFFKIAMFTVVACSYLNTQAQNGFEINSILVDACGSPEGENEMVRFTVGNNPLNVADLSVSWPNTNNTFKGVCQDATTLAKVDSLNQGIAGCGMLLEPNGGILPANAKVLLVSSTNFSTMANSFANLNDTLYIIFQCAGNTNGHFANYSTTAGIRTLTMSFALPVMYIDSVSYDRTILVNQTGGIGGGSTINDGAIVLFNNAGTPTYANYGCQALVSSLFANAGSDIIACNAGAINLSATVNGNYSAISWGGGSGTFANINALSTTYTPGPTDTGFYTLSFFASGDCGITSSSYINIYSSTANPAPILTAVGSTLYCSVASASYTYSWSLDGNATTGSFYIKNATTNGCYQVTVTDASGCSVQSNIVCITNTGIDEHTSFNCNIQPNPANNLITLQISAQKSINTLNVRIKDIIGKEVLQHSFDVIGNTFKAPLQIEMLAAGVYFMEATTTTSQQTIKFIKQ
jgi:hypothetical protein